MIPDCLLVPSFFPWVNEGDTKVSPQNHYAMKHTVRMQRVMQYYVGFLSTAHPIIIVTALVVSNS